MHAYVPICTLPSITCLQQPALRLPLALRPLSPSSHLTSPPPPLPSWSPLYLRGGGLYQQDWLYEWCDANGLLIWQEVMAACNPYPLTQELMREVRTSVVRREKAVQGRAAMGLQGERGDAIFVEGEELKFA